MNLGQIRDLALSWLDDTDASYFTTAVVNRFINQAQREAQKKLIQAHENFYTKCVETSTVADQRDYALPSDFLKLLRLERITQGSGDTAATERLHPLTLNELEVSGFNSRASTSNGVPFNYVMNKDTFSLYPVPSSVETLRLWYVPRVADMVNDGDTPDVPEEYHEYLAIMAARDGFLKDGRSLSPIESKLAYYEQLMEEDAESRTIDSPRTVVATESGFGNL